LNVLVEEYHSECINDHKIVNPEKSQELIEKEQTNHLRMKNYNQIQDQVVVCSQHIQD